VHLWARDLARISSSTADLGAAANRWAQGEEWACFAIVDASPTGDESWQGQVLFVPALGAATLLLLVGDHLVMVPAASPGLRVESVATLGLRGAGLARIV